jgi:hypothetical protein
MAVPEIVFHVGLGKVASTYLQHRFFPKLQKIHYIPTNRYRQAPDMIKKGKFGRYFVSREFDQQLEREVSWFASYYPEVKPIIIFRRHDGWAASQYRRYVKNGGHLPFTGFLDVEKDTGHWKIDDFVFYNHIEHLEKHFAHKPLILFYEELRADPWAFFDKIAAYSEAPYNQKDVSLAKVHTSYQEKELKVMRKMGKHIFGEERAATKAGSLSGWLHRRGQMLASYAVLYPSKFLPKSLVDPAPLIPPEELEKVRAFFAEDWAKVKAYAEASVAQ